jgi:DNA-binding transcriptional LysR family regulator
MNDRQLRYALSVWRERSFSKAAEKLNVSQPSVSEQISDLEAELAFKLFRRTGRGVEVTHKGQAFLHRADQVVSGLLDLSDAARQLRGGPPVSFAIGFSSSILPTMVPRVMTALKPILSRVRIETITAPTRRILRFISEERLDAGIIIECDPKDMPHNVIAEPFGKVDIVLAVPPGHRIARINEAIDLADLVDEKFILHEPDIGFGERIRSALSDRGLRPNVRAIVDDAETLKLMVRDGIGVALLPSDCVIAELAAGELHVVPMRRPLELKVNMVRLDRLIPRAAARYFRLLRSGLASTGS